MKEIWKEKPMADSNQIAQRARQLGASAACAFKTEDIQFSKQFRELCKSNACGNYGKNWMCPPAIGTFEQLKAKVLHFSEGVVFQTVCKLADSFDFEGMTKAKDVHDETFRKILNDIRSSTDTKELLALNVGACSVCETCAYPAGLECRCPEKATSSVEAHGIDVNALLTACDIPYINGPDTVSYVGLFLFKK